MGQAAEVQEPDRVAQLLGRRMKKIREAQPGLSQEKLARKVGVSRETVRRVEAGLETTTAMIDRLLWAMEADAEELLATRV
jgi:DNA-binding XRE family transcriptional regulator